MGMKPILRYAAAAAALVALAAVGAVAAYRWSAAPPAADDPGGPVADDVIEEILARGRTNPAALADPALGPATPALDEARVTAPRTAAAPSAVLDRVPVAELVRRCPDAAKALRTAHVDAPLIAGFQALSVRERGTFNEAIRDWAICESRRTGGLIGCVMLDAFPTLAAAALDCRQEVLLHRTAVAGAREYMTTGRIDTKPPQDLGAAYLFQLQTVFASLNDKSAAECEERVGAHLPPLLYTCRGIATADPAWCEKLRDPRDRLVCLSYVSLYTGLPVTAEVSRIKAPPYHMRLYRDMLTIMETPTYDCRTVLADRYLEACDGLAAIENTGGGAGTRNDATAPDRALDTRAPAAPGRAPTAPGAGVAPQTAPATPGGAPTKP